MGKDDLKQLIAHSRLNEAVDQLLELIKTYSISSKSDKSVGKLSDILIINSGKLHGLQHDKLLGILDHRNEQIIITQVQQAVLYVLDELPSEFWSTAPRSQTSKRDNSSEKTDLLEAVEILKQGRSNDFDYDIFVSFSSFDREVLQLVVEKLRGCGLRVFISDQNLIDYAGESFSQTIQQALEKSQHFILVSSPNSVKSPWVEIEYETFFNQFHVHDRKNRRIFVLKGIDFDLKFVPLFLRNMQIANNAEQIVHTLVNATKAIQRIQDIQSKNEESAKHRLALQKAEEERIENENQAKLLADQQLKEKQQKAEQDRLKQLKLREELERAEQLRLAQKAEEERIEIENQAKLLADLLLNEKQEKEEKDRQEQIKIQEQRAEQLRLEALKAEEERIEKEKEAKILADQQLNEKLQKEEQERLEQQKLLEELERAEKQRLEMLKAEEMLIEKEKQAKYLADKLLKEKQEEEVKDRLEQQKIEEALAKQKRFQEKINSHLPKGEPQDEIKMGNILYKIADKMQLNKIERCEIRIAKNEFLLLKGLLIDESAPEDIKISNEMEVKLVPSHNNAFKIVSITRQKQSVDDDSFTRWIFDVTPLITGNQLLTLVVSTITWNNHNKEIKKDIVFERIVNVITSYVEQKPILTFEKIDFANLNGNDNISLQNLSNSTITININSSDKKQQRDNEKLDQVELQKHKEEQAEQQRLEALKAEEERNEKEKEAKILADQQLNEKLQKEERERLEQQKLREELELVELKRLAAQKAEEECIKKEKQAKFLADRLLKEKQQKEEQERFAQQKLREELELAELKRLAAQKAEEERIEKEKQSKILADILLKEKQQKEEQERLEQQRLKEEQAEQRRIAAEKAEKERIEKEKKAKFLAEQRLKEMQQKAEQDRLQQLKLKEEQAEQKRLLQIEAAQREEDERLKQQKLKEEKEEQKREATKLDAEKAEKAETDFWQAVFIENKKASYYKYLKKYPQGKFANEAKQILKIIPQPLVPIKTRLFYLFSSLVVIALVLLIYFSLRNHPKDILYFEMVPVKGGEFMMGDDTTHTSDRSVHRVILPNFFICKYEVTQKQWVEVMGTNPSYFKGCDNCPVEQVSWNDALKFIKKLNEKTKNNFRLPTEAEWEFAARDSVMRSICPSPQWAGTNNEVELGDYAWYEKNGENKTHPVGTKEPNGLGIYDLSGNVWEWCLDNYGSDYYNNSPLNDPEGPSFGNDRILRGGAWNSDAASSRLTNRISGGTNVKWRDYGFRLALTK